MQAPGGLRNLEPPSQQWFHWYIPAEGEHWNRLRSEAPALANAGITGLWLPPANKGSGGANDVGYGSYDLFDLGEFDQKGTVRTEGHRAYQVRHQE
jgi:alpha-amylase